MKKMTVFITIFLFSSIAFSLAKTGNDILDRVDEHLSGTLAPKTMVSTMTMTIISKSGSKRVRKLKVWSKKVEGRDDLRLMKFLSPAEVRNVGFLSLKSDQMYLYLPEFHRVRRIASHTKRENFMGSDFSYEDLSTSSYTRYYTAKLLEETDTTWKLELTLKKGADRAYPRIIMLVDKEKEMPIHSEMFDDNGNLWKVVEEEVIQVGKYWVPQKITMKNVKKGTQTVLVFENIKVDVQLKDSIFSKRFLKRSVKP